MHTSTGQIKESSQPKYVKNYYVATLDLELNYYLTSPAIQHIASATTSNPPDHMDLELLNNLKGKKERRRDGKKERVEKGKEEVRGKMLRIKKERRRKVKVKS